MSRSTKALHEQLSRIVGADRVRTDSLEKMVHSHDLAPLPKMMELGFKMIPDAVVRPANAREVSEIVKLAVREGIPLIPRGGASWAYGGAVPAEGGIVLDMTSMSKVLRVDVENLEVEAEAGATWEKVHDEALKSGLFIGYYPSSKPAATLAGWISTGGIGVGSYKYGSVKDNIRNLEVVLGEGQVVRTGFDGVSSHSSGYSLNELFVGSEGTLGIVTKVTLKAVPAPEVVRPISVMFPSLDALFPLMHSITRARIQPFHIAFVDEFHTRYLKKMGRHVPGEGAILSIVLEGAKGSVEWEESVIDGLVKQHGGTRLPDSEAEHEWSENPYEFRVREVGVSAALGEAVVPMTEFRGAVRDLYELIRKMKMEASVIGMLGDRNTVLLMPYYLYVEKKLVKSLASLSFNKKIGDVAFAHKGRPLGFGLFFASNLKRVRGEGTDVMYDIKNVLDPHDVVNPGKLFEGITRYGMPMPALMMNMGMGMMAVGKRVMPRDTAFERSAEAHAKEGGMHGHGGDSGGGGGGGGGGEDGAADGGGAAGGAGEGTRKEGQ
jgi:glycolate oxidase